MGYGEVIWDKGKVSTSLGHPPSVKGTLEIRAPAVVLVFLDYSDISDFCSEYKVAVS